MREVDVYYPEEHSKLAIEGGSSTGLVLRGSIAVGNKKGSSELVREREEGSEGKTEDLGVLQIKVGARTQGLFNFKWEVNELPGNTKGFEMREKDSVTLGGMRQEE